METFDQITADLPRIRVEMTGHPNGCRATATYEDLACVAIDEDPETAQALAVAMLEAQIVRLQP